MMKSLIAAAAALAVLTPLAARAAPPSAAAPAAASAVKPEAEALVRRYLAAVHFERTMDVMQAAMLPVIAAQSAKANPNLTAADQQMLVEVVRRVMREKMMPKMIERMVPIYAQTFTLSELQAMVAFYESPLGRSITDKIPTLAPRSAAITRELMPEMMSEVVQELIARKCPDGRCQTAPPKASAS